jgi:spermidine/putrescine-binding protein
LLAICLFIRPAQANDVGETTVSARTSTYQFLADKSTITQTGGIAGIHRTYTITGTFRLTADFEAGTASFDIMDASAVNYSPSRDRTIRNSIDPNEIFNMTDLDGRITDGNSICFDGMADDGSNVLITLTFDDDAVTLKGETVPPPDSADFFIYTLDAFAEPKYEYSGGTGEPNEPYQIATAADLIALSETPEDYDKHFVLVA